ncbi:hypothetical protein HK097_000920 [Rhizophlyctis rosea]|uniref:Uncharacterized protein n=1 Tax=Rhizophlyctis rosea TaxID=64517 RepID=A0AAD5SNF2_9FUNG|nr:hypothetical protein HK097_000920 [Rhizophlyctis rosea]
MHNLYFFRHMITGKVLVSPYFQLIKYGGQPSLLNQIFEHRPQNHIRPDHWVPYAVLTGIKKPRTVLSIQSEVLGPRVRPDGKTGAYSKSLSKLPLSRSGKKEPFEAEWTVPEMVKDRTVALCRALNENAEVRKEVDGVLNAVEGIGAESGVVGGITDSKPGTSGSEGLLGNFGGLPNTSTTESTASSLSSSTTSSSASTDLGLAYTLWFERDEFRQVAEDAGLQWPLYVEVKKLRNRLNRYPMVPGFNMETLESDWASLKGMGLLPKKEEKPIQWRKVLAQKSHRNKDRDAKGIWRW